MLKAWSHVACLSLLFAIATPSRAADKPAFDGQWRTSFGIVTLKQSGNTVSGTYGNDNQFTLTGTVANQKLTFEYHEGQATGDGAWTLDKSGHAFQGQFKVRGGRGGTWEGWRPDPQARTGKSANLAGPWLTNLGLMELEQTGDNVKGRFALRGDSTIEGTVTGRELEFTYKSFRSGNGWFDLSPKGDALTGAAGTDGFPNWFAWGGRRAPEFARHAKAIPGKMVDGSTRSLLTYTLRAPEAYRPGDNKKWPAIVILHGSNMNAKAYVNTLASAWPDIAKEYLIIGINGEQPSDTGSDPKFNFTYINYVGKSTFKGFPGTDRESPALVAEALTELRDVYPISKYFVGGHSQGGFLTYSLLMNFPEQIAGAFPISAGVIFQCEPSAYTDVTLRAAQRAVPLAIIHSKQDPVVSFSSGQYAVTLFGDAGWRGFHFFVDTSGAGHMFARLPVGQAIRWLEAQSSDDPAKLTAFAEQRFKAGAYRDAIAALNRATTLTPPPAIKTRLDRLAHDIDLKAAPGAARFLPQIRKAESGKPWIDAFLAYRDNFEFAPAAKEVMQAFDALRVQHEPQAKTAMEEARAAFQQGNPDAGYAKYQEIVDRDYAAPTYRIVKQWLAERK
jgi:predicted esterase